MALDRNEGAGRRWVKRVGSTATLRSFNATGEDTYGDPTDYQPTEVSTFAVVVEAGGLGVQMVRDAKGEEREVDAEAFIPDDVAITVEGVEDLPELDVGGRSYMVINVRHKARPGLHQLFCEKLRSR